MLVTTAALERIQSFDLTRKIATGNAPNVTTGKVEI
jgi:hypothetical protein